MTEPDSPHCQAFDVPVHAVLFSWSRSSSTDASDPDAASGCVLHAAAILCSEAVFIRYPAYREFFIAQYLCLLLIPVLLHSSDAAGQWSAQYLSRPAPVCCQCQ